MWDEYCELRVGNQARREARERQEFAAPPDTTILVGARTEEEVIRRAGEVVGNVVRWFRANKLILNGTKTSYLLFNPKPSSIPQPIVTPEITISIAAEARFLGLTLDYKLKWCSHITDLKPKLSSAIYAIRSVRNNVDSAAAKLSYHSYFHSIMGYALIYWGFSSNVDEVFLLQKRAVRAIFGVGNRTSCKPYFINHSILTIYAQLILDACTLIHKMYPTLTKHSDVHLHNTRHKDNLVTTKNKLMDKSYLKLGNTIANVIHQIHRVYTAMNDFMQELKLYKFMSRLDGWQAQMLTQIPVRDWIRVYRVEAIQLEKETTTESSLHRINQEEHDPNGEVESEKEELERAEVQEKVGGAETAEENVGGAETAEENVGGVETAEEKVGGAETAEENVGGVETAEENVGGVETAEENVGGVETAEEKVGGAETAEEKVGGAETAEEKVEGAETAEEKVGGAKTAEEKVGGAETAEEKVGGAETAEEKVEGAETAEEKIGGAEIG
ncbi:hypothetical protein M8J77_000716 [Diaphorina citri]|nr:hypothetical protein M8J77_000716 [Diaphorina citri]